MYRGASILGTIVAVFHCFTGKPMKLVKRIFNIFIGRKVHSKGWWK